MSARLRVTLGQHSQAGRKPANQDFHGAATPSEPHLGTKGIVVALADGISSSAVSQIASAAAVRGFLDDYYCTSEAWSVRRAGQRVLQATNSWLHAQTQRSDARFDKDRGYVCTFSALIFKGRQAHLLHVGDTRVYRLHAQALEQLSEDHRVRVSSVETYLGRALGAGPAVEIDYRSWDTEVGEVYLLATDGAYEYLDAPTVHTALAQHPDDLNEAARSLTTTALARGSQDNLTVQLVRIDALPETSPQNLPAQREGLKLPPALRPRAHFEGYTIVRELHASSRSHVHLAVDHASGQQVALKTPSVDLREDPAYLDRFLLEEWIARRIDSAHVIKAFDTPRPREHLYVAMEYIEGQTLAQWMTDHPRPDLDTVRGLIEQAAKGLQAFHRKEMLHQDLRPENLMIDRTGTVKIIDVGSAHVAGLTEGTAEALPQALAGSLQYTAPEYFVGGVGSARSELFSLAVLAYQMLTGHLPYGLQITQLRSPADLRHLRYIAMRERRPDLPPWIDAVLRRALHPQPSKRQEALSEFIHDLHNPSTQYQGHRSSPLIERNPVVFWQSLSLLLAIAVLVLMGLLLSRQ
ncbi:protein kinase domain-containing protein [Aquabacterium sp.]|uniref:protein kinase domain-containing protein n=1 Tax=Aquabacterium sp. TaxID=1872578 RepID=UPI003D6CBBCE